MTVTPARTEGQTVDTAETLQALGLDLIKWLEERQAEIEAELERRMEVIGERFNASSVPGSMQEAILADLQRRLVAFQASVGA